MATPEQSRPARTGRTDLDARSRSVPETHGPGGLGPEPEDNQPRHHPPEEQDQPPLDDFAARLGIPSERREEPAEAPGSPVAEPAATVPGAGDEAGEAGSGLPLRCWSFAVRRGCCPCSAGCARSPRPSSAPPAGRSAERRGATGRGG